MPMLEPKRQTDRPVSISAPGHLRLLVLAAAMMTIETVGAQGVGTQAVDAPTAVIPPSVDIRPSVYSRLTYSDNIHADDDKRSDWVVEVAPGIAAVRERGRLTGRLNALMRNVAHAREGDRDTSYVALDGSGQLEAVRGRLFVDMAAATRRNNRSSVFGRESGDFLSTDSSDETWQFSIGPRWHFRLGGVDGTASYRQTWYDGGGSTLSRDVGTSSLGLSNPDAFGRLGWGLQYSRTDTRYDDISDELMQEVTRGTLYLNVSRKLRFFGTVGHEKTDYDVRSGEEGTIKGGGFEWFPTPRTSIAADTEDRFFGQSYHLDIGHRRARSEWDLSWSRDVTSSIDTDGAIFEHPEFQSLYGFLVDRGNLSPLEAQQAALDVLSRVAPALRDNFITNNYYVSKALRGSFSIIGVRNRLTFALQRSESRRLGDPIVVAAFDDDLSIFNTIRTRAATVSLDHSVSATTTLTLSARRSESEGSRSTEDAETKRTVLAAGLSRSLGAYTTAALTYRYQKATGTTEFTENVLMASLAMQF